MLSRSVRCSRIVLTSVTRPYRETMVATAGKKASSVKNATPPDVYRMRSAIIPSSTRQRMSRQPSGGIVSGAVASRPRPRSRDSFQRHCEGILVLTPAFGLLLWNASPLRRGLRCPDRPPSARLIILGLRLDLKSHNAKRAAPIVASTCVHPKSRCPNSANPVPAQKFYPRGKGSRIAEHI